MPTISWGHTPSPQNSRQKILAFPFSLHRRAGKDSGALETKTYFIFRRAPNGARTRTSWSKAVPSRPRLSGLIFAEKIFPPQSAPRTDFKADTASLTQVKLFTYPDALLAPTLIRPTLRKP